MRIRELEDHIGVDVKSVKAATHRCDSFANAAGRFVLYADAYLTVAEEMVATGSVAKPQAMELLYSLLTEVLVQAAMLADAADDRLLCARLLDERRAAPSSAMKWQSTWSGSSASCIGPVWLAARLHIVHAEGLATLEGSAGGGARHHQLGLSTWVPPGNSNKCLARARNFTEVAQEVLEAEFPSYDLHRAFCIFNMAKFGGGLTPHHTADDMPEDVPRAFRRLAQAFNVDLSHLVAQHNDHSPMARRVKNIPNCSNPEAWSEALRKTQRYSKSSHPVGARIPVLQRYLCYIRQGGAGLSKGEPSLG